MKEQLQVDELPVIRRALEQYKKTLDGLIKNDDPLIKINLFEEDLNKLSYQTNDLIEGMDGNKFQIVYDNNSVGATLVVALELRHSPESIPIIRT
jgi:hypothetical protein